MARAFDLLEEAGDAVETDSRLQLSEIARDYLERNGRSGSTPGLEAAPEHVVDDVSKCPTGTARFRPEFTGDVFVEGERGSHTMMLPRRHHDVESRGGVGSPHSIGCVKDTPTTTSGALLM